MSIAALLVDPLDVPISWRDIGGLSTIISEIKVSPKYFTQVTCHLILPTRRSQVEGKCSFHVHMREYLLLKL